MDSLLDDLTNDSVIRDQSNVKHQVADKDEPYTFDYKTLVMNHPLFLMAFHNRYQLMSHPLSRNLVKKKFSRWSLIIFISLFIIYAAFLGIYTTIVLRTEHPQKYYNLTGFLFDSNLCENVTQALGNVDLKENTDNVLRHVMLGLLIANLVKSAWAIIGYVRVDYNKIFTFIFEIISWACSYYFVSDYGFQKNLKMRCPYQWEFGAYGLCSGYLGLFYYIQYIPIIGIYVIMMRQILIRFLLFLPVLAVLICAFTLPLYMIFQNFEVFHDVIVSLAKIGIDV